MYMENQQGNVQVMDLTYQQVDEMEPLQKSRRTTPSLPLHLCEGYAGKAVVEGANEAEALWGSRVPSRVASRQPSNVPSRAPSRLDSIKARRSAQATPSLPLNQSSYEQQQHDQGKQSYQHQQMLNHSPTRPQSSASYRAQSEYGDSSMAYFDEEESVLNNTGAVDITTALSINKRAISKLALTRVQTPSTAEAAPVDENTPGQVNIKKNTANNKKKGGKKSQPSSRPATRSSSRPATARSTASSKTRLGGKKKAPAVNTLAVSKKDLKAYEKVKKPSNSYSQPRSANGLARLLKSGKNKKVGAKGSKSARNLPPRVTRSSTRQVQPTVQRTGISSLLGAR